MRTGADFHITLNVFDKPLIKRSDWHNWLSKGARVQSHIKSKTFLEVH